MIKAFKLRAFKVTIKINGKTNLTKEYSQVEIIVIKYVVVHIWLVVVVLESDTEKKLIEFGMLIMKRKIIIKKKEISF